MNEHRGRLMRIMQRQRRWAAPIVALVAVAAVIGLLPHFGFTGAQAPIWTERSSAQSVQMQSPDWVRLSKRSEARGREHQRQAQCRIVGDPTAQRAS